MNDWKDWEKFISQYDLIYENPPVCWQDGLVTGNGSLGAVFFANDSLQWLVNKTDVLDARTCDVKRIIPPDEAAEMVRDGVPADDFNQHERGEPASKGIGPKTCCRLTMDMGLSGGAGTLLALPDIKSRLSLHDATLRINLDKHLSHPRVESFVRADQDMLVMRVRDVSPIIGYRTKIFFSRPEDIDLATPEISIERGNRLVMKMAMPEAGHYVAALQITPKPTHAYRENLLPKIRDKYHPPLTGSVSLEVRGRYGIATVGGDFDVLLTVVTTQDCEDPLAEAHHRLDAATEMSGEQIKSNHDAWWADFWQKSWVELGNKQLEQLFYNSLYALGCAYRKAPMSGLCGLCYGPSQGPVQITPWAGDLHHDLNVQCPFFPVHALNHSELFDAYLDTYQSFLPEARRLAREVWQAPGAHFDMCFNARGKSVMGGVGKYRYFFGGSYVALMHCLCWKYRKDTVQLREKIYPFLKEILEFYLHIMKKGDDGMYHIRPAHAVELDVTDCADPVQVISMLRICLETALEGAAILDTDKDLATRWKDMLDHLPAYSRGIDAKGREVVVDGAGIAPDHHVGQAGCLLPAYPCGEIDEFSDSETLDLYNRTLDSVVEKTAQISYAQAGGFHYRCVWQCFFRAMTALRLGRVDEFWDTYLPMMLRAYTKPNGLMSNDAAVIESTDASEANLANIPDESMLDVGEEMPKFEAWCGIGGGTTANSLAKRFSVPLIEANADYLTMIVETLLQSHNGIIRVFPAWPRNRNGQFVNLIAEGNIAVSARLSDGEVEFVRLKAGQNRTKTVKLKSPWTGKIMELDLSAAGELTLTATG